MRRTILLGLFALLFALLVVIVAKDACAQRRGGEGRVFVRGGYGFHRARAMSPYGFGYSYMPYDSGAELPFPAGLHPTGSSPAGLFCSAAGPVPPAACAARRRAAGASCDHGVQMACRRRGFFSLRALQNLRLRATGLCHCPQRRFNPLRRLRLLSRRRPALRRPRRAAPAHFHERG